VEELIIVSRVGGVQQEVSKHLAKGNSGFRIPSPDGFLDLVEILVAGHDLVDETAHFFVSFLNGADGLSILEHLRPEEIHGHADHKDKVNVFELLLLVGFL